MRDMLVSAASVACIEVSDGSRYITLENRPNTSELANAVNEGRGLP